MGEASPKNGVNPMSIQGIIQDEVVLCMVTDGDDHREIDAAENTGSGDKSTNLHTKDQ